MAADALLEQMTDTSILQADKGYDGDAVRRNIEQRHGTKHPAQKPTDAGRAAPRPSSIAPEPPAGAFWTMARIPARSSYSMSPWP